ncbi:ATP-binding protein [Haloimpatiens sp. FM7330]|uniref:ATP-binding protein n=1 Tax=Haloimpatiens sp. FM7330 TaxID=3298610 RepID=UPI0036278ABD
MKLQQKITALIIVILLVVIGSISILSYREMKSLLKEQRSSDLMRMAIMASELDVVKNNVGKKDGEVKIQQDIEKIRLQSKVEFIVVMDMNGIRYSHPVPKNIGKRFKGGDEEKVLTNGETYVSEAKGTLGKSLRAFAPIYKEGKQVGAISVGMSIEKMHSEIFKKMNNFMPFLVLGLVIGGISGGALAYNIKKTIFGLEPKEIAWILREKEAILQSVHEGILALDKDGKILFFNESASLIIGLKEEYVGKNINKYIYEEKINEVIKKGQSLYNVEVKIKPGLTVMCNYTPMKDKRNEVVGAVVSFKDLTDVKELAEELTGIKKILNSLRAQNHEFMNKLHIISGLIQLEEYDKALKFILKTVEKRTTISNILTDKIKNAMIAGLLLAKYNKAEEDKVKLYIDKQSKLETLPQYMTSEELGTIIGNLIENSLDVVKNDGTGLIKVGIYEQKDNLIVKVSDNGPGISDKVRENIYDIGVTTKEGQRGYGMYITKKIIDEAKGSINFNVDNGTQWFIKLPMFRR